MSAAFPGAATGVGGDPYMSTQLNKTYTYEPGSGEMDPYIQAMLAVPKSPDVGVGISRPDMLLGGGLTQLDPSTGLPYGAAKSALPPGMSINAPGFVERTPAPQDISQFMAQMGEVPAGFAANFAPQSAPPAPPILDMSAPQPQAQPLPGPQPQPIIEPVTQQPVSQQIQNIGLGAQNLVQMLGAQSQPQTQLSLPPLTAAQQQPLPQVASLFQTQPQPQAQPQPLPFQRYPNLMQNPAFNPRAQRAQRAQPQAQPPAQATPGRMARRLGVSRAFARR